MNSSKELQVVTIEGVISDVITMTTQQLSTHAAGTKRAEGRHTYRATASALVLADGTTLSVQAGKGLYSTPRTNYAKLYTHVEVGFPPFTPPKSWMGYAEDPDSPQHTIYPYIPIELVLDYINSVGLAKTTQLLA